MQCSVTTIRSVAANGEVGACVRTTVERRLAMLHFFSSTRNGGPSKLLGMTRNTTIGNVLYKENQKGIELCNHTNHTKPPLASPNRAGALSSERPPFGEETWRIVVSPEHFLPPLHHHLEFLVIHLSLLGELLHLGHACVQDVRRSCARTEDHLEPSARGNDKGRSLIIECCP